MKTTRQLYEEYLETQQKRLAKLQQEKEMIERDIEAVKDMLESVPYESDRE